MKEWVFKDNDGYKWKVKEDTRDKTILKTELTIQVFGCTWEMLVFGCTWEMLDKMQQNGLLHFQSVKEI